jgi:hypothetical protein
MTILALVLAVVLAWIGIIYATLVSQNDKAMRFDVNEVGITKDGDNLILKPVRPNLADAFYALGELHDAFKEMTILALVLAVVLAWIGIIYATLVSQNDQLR